MKKSKLRHIIKELINEQKENCYSVESIEYKGEDNVQLKEQGQGAIWHEWEGCYCVDDNGVQTPLNWGPQGFSFIGVPGFISPGSANVFANQTAFYNWVASFFGGNLTPGDSFIFDMSDGGGGMCSIGNCTNVSKVCFKYTGPVVQGFPFSFTSTVWNGTMATINKLGCCEDRGGQEEGCGDQNASNYNQCCNGDPNCVPVIMTDTCCEYEFPDVECHKCENGYPVGNMFPNPPGCDNAQGWYTVPTFNSDDCFPSHTGEPGAPDDMPPIDKGLSRLREILQRRANIIK